MKQAGYHTDDGLSWSGWARAAALLDELGMHTNAEAISNVLAGADPREEFGLARIRCERRLHRDQLIADLAEREYADLPLSKTITQIERDWRDYESRAGARDRFSRKPMPLHYTEKWAVFWTINNLGMGIPAARQIRNILSRRSQAEVDFG